LSCFAGPRLETAATRLVTLERYETVMVESLKLEKKE
jgi:hypothetical protein